MPKPPEVLQNHTRDGLEPLPELSRMSAETPMLKNTGPGIHDWIVTGREQVRAILGDAQRFTTRPPADSEEESRQITQIGNPLQYDPPEHTRLRQMLTPEFTVRRMRRMEPLIEKIVEDRLDVLERAGQPADLMRHFAWPIPGLVGCTLLGVPRDDQPELARNLDLSRRANRNWQLRQAAVNAFDGYLARFVKQKRRDPGDDMLGMLIQDHGADVTDKELVGICASVIAAGMENVAGMLGLGTLALLDHPGQLELLREKPELMDQAVEEVLRYVAVVPIASPRTALEDVTIGGQEIKEGEIVSCSLLAVNRAQLDDTDRDEFRVDRENVSHMAFGHGIHFCVGAALARMELRTAYTGLLRRFPGLRLAVLRQELRFRPPLLATYGVEKLPVAW
ncbi:cytochrome P450 [Streptomyces sp. HUAS TT20]|uniref:cytochrome P450 n=1 Tax=Streptomyces sp. HUAS TT20 TaxID=3447509 RepID=UPI0021DB7361|nr:cytochrome P450 [Streptomyces sp. HUAS 15-9]UXY31772.1 cytochrome P450 [Streptomyces sp. HUAS 15-9]